MVECQEPDEVPERRCGRCGAPSVVCFQEDRFTVTTSLGEHPLDPLDWAKTDVDAGAVRRYGCSDCGRRFTLLSEDRVLLFTVLAMVLGIFCAVMMAALPSGGGIFVVGMVMALGFTARLALHAWRDHSNPEL